MVCIQTGTFVHHSLQNTQSAPLFNIRSTVIVTGIICSLFINCFLFQINTNLIQTLQQQFGNFLQFYNRNITHFPFLEKLQFHLMTDFTSHFRNSTLLTTIECFYTLFTEVIHEEIIHDVIKFIQRAVCLLCILCITNSLVMPIIIERRIIRIRFQNLLLQGKMQVIKHPLAQIICTQIFLTIVLISFFIDKSLVLAPVIVFELE